jgi:tetratricopeptide (TPR) repeat protein
MPDIIENIVIGVITPIFTELTGFLIKKVKEVIDYFFGKPNIITKTSVANMKETYITRHCIEAKVKCYINAKKPISLCGMGGIGKTEMCRKLYKKYSQRGKGIRYLGWLEYNNSFLMQLKETFRKSNNIENKDSAKEFLHDLGDSLLLFVDNVDDISQNTDDFIKHIIAIPACRVVITTRKLDLNVDRIKKIEIGILSKNRCVNLFRKHYKGGTNAIVRKIVERAGLLTLAVELLAKTARHSGLPLEEFLNKLEKEGVNLPSIREKIKFEEKEGSIMELFSKIFNLANINNDEEKILRNICILPGATSIKKEWIKNWLHLEDLNVVNSLCNKGWLTENTLTSILMHPVISDTVKNKLQPTLQDCESMIACFASDVGVKSNEETLEKWELLPFYIAASDYFKEEKSEYIIDMNLGAGRLYKDQGEYEKALEYHRRAKSIAEKMYEPNHPRFAIIHTWIGIVYFQQNELQRAGEEYQQARALCESPDYTDRAFKATAYNHIGLYYLTLKDQDNALKLFEESYDIRRELFGEKSTLAGFPYRNKARVYKEQGKLDDELKIFIFTKEVFTEELAPIESARCDSYIGEIFEFQKNYPSALKFYTKARKILQKHLSAKHPAVIGINKKVDRVRLEH